MEFRKIIVALGISSILAVSVLMGVSPVLATEECERVRLDNVDLEEIVVGTRDEAEALLRSWPEEFAAVSFQSDSELQVCGTTEEEMIARLDEEGPFRFLSITGTNTSTSNNTCEDPVCGPDSPCPPGTYFDHYDEHGNPVCQQGGSGGGSVVIAVLML